MIVSRLVSDNIFSSLGCCTNEVYASVVCGLSGVDQHIVCGGESVVVSKVGDGVVDAQFGFLGGGGDYTIFEKMVIVSLFDAAARGGVDLSSDRSLIILSTTKGNVELLGVEGCFSDRVLLSSSAAKIGAFFSTTVAVQVISSACISGVSALIMANRYLVDGLYDRVAVVGCDVVSDFVVSGFSSFKALSSERCRPFDSNRRGLNIGQGSSAMILEGVEESSLQIGDIYIGQGAITNDATHISAPSRTGQGLFEAIDKCAAGGVDFVVAHGTATAYNDAMEAIALARAGLDKTPTLSLKWHFGHTLGAAGVVETVIGCRMLSDNLLLPSGGCEEQDEICAINLSNQKRSVPLRSFLKTISGFGGCNAAIVIKKMV